MGVRDTPVNPPVAVITGASRGFGKAIARALWNEGYSVACVGRDRSAIDRSISELPRLGEQKALAISADFSDSGSAFRVAQEHLGFFGRLDVLVNNAAIQGPVGTFAETNLESWMKAIQVDLLSPVAMCRAFVPSMLAQGGGAIINISGGGATGPRPNFSAYATAKCALVRFSETLASELRGSGVAVNCVAPGAMATDMLSEVLHHGEQAAGEREIAAARRALEEGNSTLERAVGLVSYLASVRGRRISGRLISAVWDPWPALDNHEESLSQSDIYTLRRIVPEDRGWDWSKPA